MTYFPPAQPYPNLLQRMTTKTKVVLAGAVLAVIAVIASGHDHGPTAFLHQLHEEGFHNGYGDSAELANGNRVCAELNHSSHTEVAHTFWMSNPKLSYDDALEFVTIADDYLC